MTPSHPPLKHPAQHLRRQKKVTLMDVKTCTYPPPSTYRVHEIEHTSDPRMPDFTEQYLFVFLRICITCRLSNKAEVFSIVQLCLLA